MFQGLLALLGRSLRIDSRSWQVHLARLGLMVAIYVALAFAFVSSGLFGAPGLRFFYAIVWLDVAFLTLLGVGFFSTAISEEKEEDTLGLMQMAGMIPLGILLGKLGGRLIQALLLIAVQYPFTLLAVTMGGVNSNQVACAFTGLTAFMLMMAGLGLLCSTIAPRNRTAAGMMVLGLVAYVVLPYAAYETYQVLVSGGQLSGTSTLAFLLLQVSSTCLFLQIPTILTSSFGESPWSIQVISNSVGGGVCFLVAWSLFEVCTRDAATERASRGLLSRKKGWFRCFAPGRPRINPYLWKDFHFIGGGVGMLLARFAFYLGLLAVTMLLGEFWWGMRSSRIVYQESIGIYQLLMLAVVTLEMSVLAARILHDEIREQTLAALVMLPESLTILVYGKLLGVLLAAMPGAFFLLLTSLGTEAGRYNSERFLDHPAGWLYLSHFLLVPHLAAVLAMSMRWGGVPLAIGLGISSLFSWIFLFQSFHVGPRDGIVTVATLFALAVCVGCHIWIALRLPSVGARS